MLSPSCTTQSVDILDTSCVMYCKSNLTALAIEINDVFNKYFDVKPFSVFDEHWICYDGTLDEKYL